MKAEHILLSGDLILKIDFIKSAHLNAKDSKGKHCIKINMTTGETWIIYRDLESVREILKSIPNLNDQFDLIENIKNTVLVSRDSKLKKELEKILQIEL